MDILLYTNSAYSWVWPYWVKQTNKYHYFDDRLVLVDADTDSTLSKADFALTDYLYYKNSDSYKDRILGCLKQLYSRDRVVLFMHEDMFLYETPNHSKLEEFYAIVKSNKADVIKLIRAEDFAVKSELHENLYLNPPNLRFAIQPSIIKIGKLIEVFESCNGSTIWELESGMFVSQAVNPLKSFYCYNGESKRGSSHYDSNIYPYIATAVVKGKWNTKEYPVELNKILSGN